MRDNHEYKLHCKVVAFLEMQYPDLLFFHAANGEHRSKITGARLKRMGVRPGVADLLLFWMDGIEPMMAAVELKAPKKYLSPNQKKFRNDWVNSGGLYAICRSEEEVISQLNGWGVPKNRRLH